VLSGFGTCSASCAPSLHTRYALHYNCTLPSHNFCPLCCFKYPTLIPSSFQSTSRVISDLTELVTSSRLSSHTFSCEATSVNAMLMLSQVLSAGACADRLARPSRGESSRSSASRNLGRVTATRCLSMISGYMTLFCRVVCCRPRSSGGISARWVSENEGNLAPKGLTQSRGRCLMQ
jgi:hypothetical protein